MDVFYEESALVHNSEKKQKKYNILTAISTVFLVLGILWIIIGFYTINIKSLGDWIAWGFICLWLFSAWFMLRMWKMRINVSYDYAFVSGELRISKVINVNKRKLVARIDCDDMIQFGDAENPSFERFRSDPNVKTVFCTSNDVAAEGKFFMYVLAEYNGKKLFVLECRELMLMNILKFARRNKLESDYVMQEKKQAR
jgi:hypothetical protein